jgi:hypothetical protein
MHSVATARRKNMSQIYRVTCVVFIAIGLQTGCLDQTADPRSEVISDESASSREQSASAAPTPQYKERWSAIQRGTTERNVAYDGGDFLHSTADYASVTFPISNLTVGETFAKIAVLIKGTGAPQQVAAHLLRADGDGNSTLLHSVIAYDPPATWQAHSLTWTPTALDVVESGKAYYWYINIPTAGTFIGHTGYFVIEP